MPPPQLKISSVRVLKCEATFKRFSWAEFLIYEKPDYQLTAIFPGSGVEIMEKYPKLGGYQIKDRH